MPCPRGDLVRSPAHRTPEPLRFSLSRSRGWVLPPWVRGGVTISVIADTDSTFPRPTARTTILRGTAPVRPPAGRERTGRRTRVRHGRAARSTLRPEDGRVSGVTSGGRQAPRRWAPGRRHAQVWRRELQPGGHQPPAGVARREACPSHSRVRYSTGRPTRWTPRRADGIHRSALSAASLRTGYRPFSVVAPAVASAGRRGLAGCCRGRRWSPGRWRSQWRCRWDRGSACRRRHRQLRGPPPAPDRGAGGGTAWVTVTACLGDSRPVGSMASTVPSGASAVWSARSCTDTPRLSNSASTSPTGRPT